jgi:anti-sigma B factor antagonist
MQRSTLEMTAHPGDGVTSIELRGDIDGSARDALAAAYAAGGADGTLLLDFGGVGYINSTGIALIVGLLARARSESRPVSARGLTAHYREIFEITRLSDFMTILADEPSPPNDYHGAPA